MGMFWYNNLRVNITTELFRAFFYTHSIFKFLFCQHIYLSILYKHTYFFILVIKSQLNFTSRMFCISVEINKVKKKSIPVVLNWDEQHKIISAVWLCYGILIS